MLKLDTTFFILVLASYSEQKGMKNVQKSRTQKENCGCSTAQNGLVICAIF